MTTDRYSLIPSLDLTTLDETDRIVGATASHEIVYGYKIGFSLGLAFGLPKTVEAIRRRTSKPIIYDHQKAGTDIPDTGNLFARTMKDAGINEAILFPQAGPDTLKAWMKALDERSVKIIVGGMMTHHGYLASEGGFLGENGPEEMYRTAVSLGAKAFVVPLTRPERIRELLNRGVFPAEAEFYSPGFGAQGGDPGAFPRFGIHRLIVGRALLSAPDPRAWLESCSESLRRLS